MSCSRKWLVEQAMRTRAEPRHSRRTRSFAIVREEQRMTLVDAQLRAPELEAKAEDTPAGTGKKSKVEKKTEDKPAGTGKKTKMVMVSPMYIKWLQMKMSKRRARKPFCPFPEEVLKGLDPELQAQLRAQTAAMTSHIVKGWEKETALLKQYDDKGYAEIEVTDDEYEDEEYYYY